jgi:hypothetical protein
VKLCRTSTAVSSVWTLDGRLPADLLDPRPWQVPDLLLESSCFAVSAEHDRSWIQIHRHGHQRRREGWCSELKASPPPAHRRHWHLQPIGQGPHPKPTDDAEGQSVANHLDRPPGLCAEDAAKATVRAFLADTDRQDLQALQKHPGL